MKFFHAMKARTRADSSLTIMYLFDTHHVLIKKRFGRYSPRFRELKLSQVTLFGTNPGCRVLGDPMQSIFDFDNAKPVDWEASVYPKFECLGELDIPWRWARNPQLGAWLKDVRNKIQAGQKIDLLGNRPPCVIRHRIDPENLEKKQYSSLYGLLNHNESVIALHGGDQQSKNKTHLLARSMAGRYSSIERIAGKGLHTFLKQVNGTRTTQKRFLLALEFAKKCFTGVSIVLTAETKRGEVAALRKGTKYPALLSAANTYLADPTSLNLMRFFLELKANPETGAYRRDLLNRLLQILKLHGEYAEMTIISVSTKNNIEAGMSLPIS